MRCKPGVEPMLSGLARQRQRFVDPGQGGFRVSRLGFDFREQPLKKRQNELVALTGVFRQRLSELGRAGVPIAELRAPPGREQRSKGQPERKTVLPTERDTWLQQRAGPLQRRHGGFLASLVSNKC